MKKGTMKALWVAGAAAVSLVCFLLLGTILGGHPLRWDIHVMLASAVFTVIIGTASALLWAEWRKRQDVKAGYPARQLLIVSILANTALFGGFRWHFLHGREGV